MAPQTRRRFLLGATGAAVGTFAGCLDAASTDSAPGDGRRTAAASFFVVGDFVTNVADGAMNVNNLVPFGQHGHGWEPGPGIQRDVLSADVFVYVGEGFQPWADDVVRNVRSDGADVEVIEAREGVELLDASAEADGDHESNHESGAHGTTGAHHGHEGHDHHVHNESTAGTNDHDAHGESPDGHEGHGDGAVDPHFWLDPRRSIRSVRTIARRLGQVDPGNESAYAGNADAFVERLDALDTAFHERLSGRTRDAVLVAGHNSFRYLGRRYGFHVEALTDLAPDAAPTPQDVKRAQAVVDEHDVEHVLAPVFESDRAARQLVEETDASGVLPLTPVPTLTEEWADEGWGYVEVMEHVNLPSLARALGVE